MTPPPVALSAEAEDAVTRERLRLLSLAFYISGAIGAVFVSILLVHLAVLIGFSFMPASGWTNGQGAPTPLPPMLFPLLAVGVGSIILCGWTLGGLTIYAGRCIARRRHRVFVMIIGGVNLVWIPYGTLLGIAAIGLLATERGKAAFLPPAMPPGNASPLPIS